MTKMALRDAIVSRWRKLDSSTKLLIIGVSIYLFLYVYVDIVLAIARLFIG